MHDLKSDLTAYWLNRALGLLHCRGKMHDEPHWSPPAARLPWWRLTLSDLEPGCVLTVLVYVQFVLPRYYLIRSPSQTKITQQKSRQAVALRRHWVLFFTCKIGRAPWHAGLLSGLLFCTEHSRWSMRQDRNILTYTRPYLTLTYEFSLQNAIRNPNSHSTYTFNSKGEPI